MEIKPVSKNNKILFNIAISSCTALILDVLSFFIIKYKHDPMCLPPVCIGQYSVPFYGFPFKYLTSSGFYPDKFLYNFFIYFLIILFIIYFIQISKSTFIRKQLKRSLIYSLISAILLTAITSFIPHTFGCYRGSMCLSGPQTYYGFPLSYLSDFFHVHSYKFLLLNFSIYFIISFITIFCIIMIINYCKNKKTKKRIKISKFRNG